MVKDDPLDFVAAEQEQEEAEKQRLRLQKLEAEDYKWMFSNRRGRRICWRLLDRAGVFRTSFTGDSNGTIFNEGRRDYGLFVMAQFLEHSPDKYQLMLEEQRTYERSRTSSTSSDD